MVALPALVGFAIVVAHPAQAAADRCQDIPGVWSWFDGHTVTLSRDGAARGVRPGRSNQGTWRCLDSATGQIEIRWQKGGWIDKLTLSADGNTIAGKNQFLIPVKGILVRRDAPPPQQAAGPARPPAKPAQPAVNLADASRDCASADVNAKIRGCTLLIDSKRLSGPDLASVYASRGHAHWTVHDVPTSIFDFDKAIALAPRDPHCASCGESEPCIRLIGCCSRSRHGWPNLPIVPLRTRRRARTPARSPRS